MGYLFLFTCAVKKAVIGQEGKTVIHEGPLIQKKMRSTFAVAALAGGAFAAVPGDEVKSLPGFSGELPSKC